MKNLSQEFIKNFGTFENIKCAFISFKPFNNIDEDGELLIDDDKVLSRLPKDSVEAALKTGYTQFELMEFVKKLDVNFIDEEEVCRWYIEDMDAPFTFHCWFSNGSYTKHTKKSYYDNYEEQHSIDFDTIKIPIIPTNLI